MDPRENLLRIYRELSDWYERQRQPQMRDRFLVLAADAALLAGRPDEAERFRLHLLRLNPHHMLKPYTSFAQALKAPDVSTYVKDLRANYPADVAEDLLRTLQGSEKPPAAGDVPSTELGASLAPPTAPDEPFFNPAESDADLGRTAMPGPLNAPRARPAVPQTIPLQPSVPARPAPTRPVGLPRGESAPPRRTFAPLPPDARPPLERPADEPTAVPGSWVGVLLFVVVVASAAALGGFSFLRPYLMP